MDLVSSLSSNVDTELDEMFLGEHTLLKNKLDSILVVRHNLGIISGQVFSLFIALVITLLFELRP